MAVYLSDFQVVFGDVLLADFRVDCGEFEHHLFDFLTRCGQHPYHLFDFQVKPIQKPIHLSEFRLDFLSTAAHLFPFRIDFQSVSDVFLYDFRVDFESKTTETYQYNFLVQFDGQVSGYDEETFDVAAVVNGNTLKSITTASVNLSESSYLIEAQITINDPAEVAALSYFDSLILSRYGQDYHLKIYGITESKSVDFSSASRSWDVSASSPTFILSYSERITETWPAGTMAQAIALEVTTAHGISLEWDIPDYPVKEYAADNQAPIDIIRGLLITGGVMESTRAGALRIRKDYEVDPATMETATPDYTLLPLFVDSMRESVEDPKLTYNAIIVTDISNTAEDNAVSFQHEEEPIQGGLIVQGIRMPWLDGFHLDTSGGSLIIISDYGIKTAEITETVEFIDGIASTSKPILSDFVSEWSEDDLGAIGWEPDSKELTTGGVDESLAIVTYTYRYREYYVYAPAERQFQLIWRDDVD